MVIILCRVHQWWFPRPEQRIHICSVCVVVKSIHGISACRFWRLSEWELYRVHI